MLAGEKGTITVRADVWPDAQIDELKRLWADGLSASRIAAALNDKFKIYLTRNAVIGKAMRSGLSKGRQVARSARIRPRKAKRLNGARSSPRRMNPGETLHLPTLAPPEPIAVPTEATRLRLVELEIDQCKYPLGFWLEPAEFFCGAPTLEGWSYCRFHQQITGAGIPVHQSAHMPCSAVREQVFERGEENEHGEAEAEKDESWRAGRGRGKGRPRDWRSKRRT